MHTFVCFLAMVYFIGFLSFVIKCFLIDEVDSSTNIKKLREDEDLSDLSDQGIQNLVDWSMLFYALVWPAIVVFYFVELYKLKQLNKI